jgi:hypothetical protein
LSLFLGTLQRFIRGSAGTDQIFLAAGFACPIDAFHFVHG